MGVEDKRKTEQLPLEGERSFPGTAVRSPNYALDWGMGTRLGDGRKLDTPGTLLGDGGGGIHF